MCESVDSNNDGNESSGELKRVSTFTAQIYTGVKDEFSVVLDRIYRISKIRGICRDYCDKVGLCVTITETEFVYTNGGEPGFIVGLINYPRFPSSPDKIKKHAIELATILKKEFKQRRVSIVCNTVCGCPFVDESNTYMLGDDDG